VKVPRLRPVKPGNGQQNVTLSNSFNVRRIAQTNSNQRSNNMDYANTYKVIGQLIKMYDILSNPEYWCQRSETPENAITISQAIAMVCGDDTAFQHNIDTNGIYPGDLQRGQIPEAAWFVRQALNKTAPEYGGLIYKWNDAPGRAHQDIVHLVELAIDIASDEYDRLLAIVEAGTECTDGGTAPRPKLYKIGIEIRWFPILIERFSDRLGEIAELIKSEVEAIGSETIYLHRFPFDSEEIVIATYWDEDLDILTADADLVAYQDVVGDTAIDGEALQIAIPIPASEANTVH
jgi:hypothetical protein